MSEPVPVEEFSRVESIFVRHRNVLAVRAQLTPIYTDYYLHLMQHELKQPPDLDGMLKDLLAGLMLHCVARPWAETIAWTVNLRAPRVNLFATGSSLEETITGRLFTEDVREPDRNFFYSQTLTQPGTEPRTSTLQVDGADPLFWVEQYYMQSEQRPAKLFRLPDETFVLIAAQPDYDEEWFEALDAAQVATLESDEETKLLETRKFRFGCGCDLEKILPVLGGWRKRPADLFGEEDKIVVQCPRCAARYLVTRDMLL
ncbi:Hsp33 family molecular chaperone HslO [Haloferula sp. A504]|uniref:Hsp33 family molecular chaperone HslO n=1 Tax=Haloferula sp. A504 TaxID=3373601 RepID=UPI0031BEFBB1|nr:Hsp33 family molecular chaperone HslO [Verrucomicrobiaceae bacterium E54]